MKEGANVWQVYMLECTDGSYYTGITNNLESRMRAHLEKKGSKYVASRLPFQVVYTESHDSWSKALKRENQVKRLSHQEKRALFEKR